MDDDMTTQTLDGLITQLCSEQQLRGEVIQGASIQRSYNEWSKAGMPPEPFEDTHLDRVFQSGIEYALRLFATKYMGVKQWDGGDGTETIEGDVMVEFGNIFAEAGLKDRDGDPYDGQQLKKLIYPEGGNVTPMRTP